MLTQFSSFVVRQCDGLMAVSVCAAFVVAALAAVCAQAFESCKSPPISKGVMDEGSEVVVVYASRAHLPRAASTVAELRYARGLRAS